ncbi:MAG: hypothetical protein KDA85_10080 [Planctomycetaceae bacterium]|nr:hypothetical protein [Planctomycetaceae bacterium]
MQAFGRQLRRWVVLTAICGMTFANSGCTLTGGFAAVLWDYMVFWKTLPAVPISAYESQKIEDRLHEEEYYDRVPVLDPIEGENAPIFCQDLPSEDQVMRALPDDPAGGVAFFQEMQRNNVKIVVEQLVDRLDECKVYPLVGPARLHHCHYKCTVYYDRVVRSYWPIPFTHVDQTEEVVYIDKDYLIRCAGPQTY